MLNCRRFISIALLCLCALSPVAAHAVAAVPAVQQVVPAATGPIAFASTAVGGGTNVVSVQLLLNQSGTLTIAAATSANGHQEFAVGAVTGCATDGTTVVSAGSTCMVPVTFQPYYPGQRSEPLMVTLGGQVYSFPLTGYATGPQSRIDPTYVNTSSGASGTTSTTATPDNVPISSALMYLPEGIYADGQNNVYIAENGHPRVRLMYATANPQIACLIIMENPTLFGLPIGANACAGATSQPTVGNAFTVAGTGTAGYSGDNGLATSAAMNITGVWVDPAGNIFIADVATTDNRIRVVYAGGPQVSCLIVTENPTIFNPTSGCTGATSLPVPGYIYTIAGTGTSGTTGDGGLASVAKLYTPQAIALDAAGDIFLTDFTASATSTVGGRIRVIYEGGANAAALILLENPTATLTVGNIYTVAGNGAAGTFSGDGALAINAGMLTLYGMKVDSYGNLYFPDKTFGTTYPLANMRVRVVYNGTVATPNPLAKLIALENPTTVANAAAVVPGAIYTVGGSTGASQSAATVDGVLATASTFSNLYDVGLDSAGDILVPDRGNYTVRRISAATGIVSTIAGTPVATQTIVNGPGLGTARFWGPWSITFDSIGGMYLADNGANRIRNISGSSVSTAASYTVPATGVGSTSITEPLIETNIGTPGSSLTIATASINSPFAIQSPAGWAGISDCTNYPVTLAGGASCSIGVNVTPLTAGLVNGTLTTTSNALGLTSATQTAAINETATGTATTLTSNPTAITAGNSTQLIATLVSGTTPVTSGSVTFSITGGATLGTGTLDPVASTATITTSLLTSPSTSITTVYPGATGVNPLFTASTVTTVLAVSAKPATTTVLTASPTAINAGQTTTLTATVTSTTSGTITGTVTFTDATSTPNITLGTAPLNAGVATLQVSTLLAGTRTLKASYGGDTTYASSTTTTSATVVVTALPTTTVVTASPAIANLNQQVTLTGTVSGLTSAGAYSGSITFKDTVTNVSYGPVAVNVGGVATFNISALSATTHTFQATYAGDPIYATSTSTVLASVIVTAPAFLVTITSANGTPVPVTVPPATSTGVAVQSGLNGTVVFTVQAVGGYTGTITPACTVTGLPAGIGCLYSPTSFVFTSNTTATETLSITTQKLNAANRMSRPSHPILAVLLLPGAGLALFGLRRRKTLQRWQHFALFCLLFAGSAMAVCGLSGCGNGLTGAPKGSYLVPVSFSDGTTTQNFSVTITIIGTSTVQ